MMEDPFETRVQGKNLLKIQGSMIGPERTDNFPSLLDC